MGVVSSACQLATIRVRVLARPLARLPADPAAPSSGARQHLRLELVVSLAWPQSGSHWARVLTAHRPPTAMAALLPGEDTFLPRLVSVFFAIFHPQHGPVVLYDVPEGSVASPPEPFVADGPNGSPPRPRPTSAPRRLAPTGHPGDLRHARSCFAPDDIDRVSSMPRTAPGLESPTTPRPGTRLDSGSLLSPPLLHRGSSDRTCLPLDAVAAPLSLLPGDDVAAEASSITLRSSGGGGKSAVTVRLGSAEDMWRRTSPTSPPDTDGVGSLPAGDHRTSRLFDFKTVEHLLMPPPTMCGRLVICSAPALNPADSRGTTGDVPRGRMRDRPRSGGASGRDGSSLSLSRPPRRARGPTEYKIVSHPVALQHEKYERMNLVYNLCFVFEAGASTTAYEGVVRKCARSLRDLELTSGFLSQPHNLRRMHNVCEQLYEDLNSYCESFISLPDQPHTDFRHADPTTPRLAVSTAAVAERALRAAHPHSPLKHERSKITPPDFAGANAAEDELEGKLISSLGDTEDGRRLREELANLDSSTMAAVSGMKAIGMPVHVAEGGPDSSSYPAEHAFCESHTAKRWEREPPHGLGRTVQDAINVKLFPTYPNPPEAQDWDVPVALLNLQDRITGDWDLTMAKVRALPFASAECRRLNSSCICYQIVPFIDGIRHVRRIAQLADADIDLTKQCMEHLLFYGCITMTDIFQYSNIYTVRPLLARDGDNSDLFAECGQYVTRLPYPVVGHVKLLQLFAAFMPTKTVGEWCEEQRLNELGVDPRRFVSFGTLKGWLRRVHRIPVLVSPSLPATIAAAVSVKPTSSSRSGVFGRRTVYDTDAGTPSAETTARLIPAPHLGSQINSWWGLGAAGVDLNSAFPPPERGRTLRSRTNARDLQLIREESLASQSPASRPAHVTAEDSQPHRARSVRRRPMANTVAESALLALQSRGPMPDLAAATAPEEPQEHDGSLELDSHIAQEVEGEEEEDLPNARPMYGGSASSGPKSRPSIASSTKVVPGILGGSSSSPPRPISRRVEASGTPEQRGGKGSSSYGLAGRYYDVRPDMRLTSTHNSTPSGPVTMRTGPRAWNRQIPLGLIDFFDGQHTDDAICTRFAVPWADVEGWVETINIEASRMSEAPTQAQPEAASTGTGHAQYGSPHQGLAQEPVAAGLTRPMMGAETPYPLPAPRTTNNNHIQSADDASMAQQMAAVKVMIM